MPDGRRRLGFGAGWRRLDALDRRILAIAVPALGSLLVEPVYVLTDTAVVGRLGTVPLGGLALASTVLNTVVWVFNFLSYGTTVRVAVRRGRGDVVGAASDARQALWLALGIGVAVALAIGPGSRGRSGREGADELEAERVGGGDLLALEGEVADGAGEAVGGGEVDGIDDAQPERGPELVGPGHAAVVERHDPEGLPLVAQGAPELALLAR
jgi:hypothetical protein